MRLTALLTIAALLACLGAAIAQDRDNDGLPDEIETQLGTNPDLDEGLQLVIDDKTRGAGDESIRDGQAPDVDKVYFAHAAGDRYVWKITFAEEYPETGTIFHLYTDIDDDKATGRQDQDWVRGVDMMYSFVDATNDPRFTNPTVRANPALPVRGIVSGNAIYVCDDAKMNVQDGKTHFRMHILSQMRDPASDSDTTEWVYVDAPLHPERKVVELPYPKPENFEAITMPNLAQLCYNLWQDERTVRLLPENAKVTGYTVLMNGDFDGTGEGTESALWQSPVEDERFVGLILRDQAGPLEALDVLIAGRKVGTVVGVASASGDVIHYTEKPVSLSRGDGIEVRTAENSAPMRFCSVCLLAEKPTVPPLTIENLAAWHIPDDPGERPGRIMIAWTTNRPAEGTIEYSLAGPEAMQQSGTLEDGRGPVNNHFVLLPPELSASGYALRITCQEPPQETYEPQAATATYTVWRDPMLHYSARGDADLPEAQALRIPLAVVEPTQRSREAWPVSSGVPLPDGALPNPANCRLLDGQGEAVPAQFTALAWHPSRIHVKWLLVDFLAETSPGRSITYTLECGVQPAAFESAVGIKAAQVEIDPPAPVGAVPLPVEINTGPLQLTLAEGGFTPFAEAMANGMYVADAERKQCGFEVTDGDGNVYSSALAPPDEVLIEDSGPIRATICVKGRLVNEAGEGHMRYLCRLHFCAGQPYVRTVFSLDNDVTDPDMNLIGSLRLRVPAELANADVLCGVDGRPLTLSLGDRLLQDEDNHFRAGATEGQRADGWLLARGDDRSLAVAVRDFWQLYPKGFAADADGISVGLLPQLPADQYAGASEDDINKLYFWNDKGRYKIRTGVRLTTEFAVDFAPEVDGDLYTRGELWQAPLFAACTPEHYCSTGAFGPMVPREAGKFEVYEHKLDEAFAKFIERRETVREYGFMNYGDWFGERKFNWGNIEYDTQWALAANFARTGNLDMLWRAEEAEWHNGDIDTTHYWPNPADVGRVFTHCTGHTGGYFARDWKNMGGFNAGPRDTGHTYAQGHFYLYALTGERRYLDAGLKVADWLANHTTNFRYYSERNVGWPMIALVGAHNVTGNPFYVNAAKLMADMAMWTQPPESGGWGHFIDPNECKHTPRCWGCKSFMTGVLLHGLKMYDLAQPRDDVKRTITKNCDFLWREAYIPKDNGFIYSQCKSFSEKGSTWTISLVGDGLAYGCLLDPEHRHEDVLLRATGGFMHQAGISDSGKGFTQGTCFMPLMLHDLDALGSTEIPGPAAGE